MSFQVTAAEAHDLYGEDHVLPDTLADPQMHEPLTAAGKAAVITSMANRKVQRV